MKAIICGDREWSDKDLVMTVLKKLVDQHGLSTVIEGGARGADSISRSVAEKLGVDVVEYPAKWEIFGKRAGVLRNSEMLNENPDLVVAFHDDLQNSKGTLNMMKQSALKTQAKVILVFHNEKGREGWNYVWFSNSDPDFIIK